MGDFEEMVREVARGEMSRRGLTHAKLAEELRMARPQVTRMLSSKTRLVPEGWIRLLDALGLELTIQPKGSSRRTKL
jgi:plasmid maintenance system antidote protein VapI